MELEKAISLLRKTVKDNGTNGQRHIDLGLVPITERSAYEKALAVVKLAIIEGKITQEDFHAKVHLN